MNAVTETTMNHRKQPVARNGVDTPTLFATIDAVRAQTELAEFRFRAQSRWINGAHSQTTVSGFYGAGGDQAHKKVYSADADHPTVLCGGDEGPTPVEYLLTALAACLTAGIANVAAARGVDLESVEATVEGDMDMRGILGLSEDVRNGFRNIRVGFSVKGDAPSEKLREIVEQSRSRSAVYDMVTNGVPVAVSVDA